MLAVILVASFSGEVAAATVTGRVTAPDGSGVSNARVILATDVGATVESATGTNGTFEATRLAGGRYELRVVVEGFQADPIDITVAEDEVRNVDVALRVSAISESIVVSASQIDVPLSQTPDSVTVVTAAELQARQIETVADALRFVPGLTVDRSGGRGALTSVFPRGGESNYTLVLADGIRLNSFGGGYDFAHLSVVDVDRIEIVRGPQSALFGSDAIGAVVQIVTRQGGPARATGFVEAGSEATVRSGIDAAGSRGAWSFGAGAEQTRSDGFTGTAPATGETVSNDDYHLAHASGTLGWHGQSGATFALNGSFEHDERGFPGPFGSNPTGAFPGVDRISRGIDDTWQIGARFTHPWSAQARQRVEANYMDLSSDFTSPYGTSLSGTKRFDGRLQEDVALSHLFSLSGGVEFVDEQGSSSYITGATAEPIPIKRSMAGTFGEVRYTDRDRLFIAAGFRLEHIVQDAVEASNDPFSPRPAFPAQTINSPNPKVALSYLLTPAGSGSSMRLHASAGTGIRPPDAFEIAFTDNPALKPERSRSVDTGIELQFPGGRYAVGATGFFNSYNDLIVTIGPALHNASQYKSDNIANARASGLELSGDARLGGGVTLYGSYTFLSTEILSVDGLADTAPPPFKVGDPLIRRPRHQGALDAVFVKHRFTAFGELTSRAQVLDVEPNLGISGGLFFAPGFTVINAGAGFHLTANLEIYGRIQNLTDLHYEETLGFPAAPRTGMIGLRVSAGR
jgi:outer membrane cobalamin receptor